MPPSTKVNPGSLLTLLEGMPAFACLLDFQARIVYMNRYVTGLRPETVLGKRAPEFILGSYKSDWLRRFKSVVRTGKPCRFETRGVTSEGRFAWYESQFIVAQRDPLLISCISLDITERKDSLERLTRSEEIFQNVFEGCREGILYAAPDGMIVKVNAALERMLGYKREELVGRKRFYDITPARYHAENRRIARLLLKRGGYAEFEKEYRRKDGALVPVLLTVFPVRGPDGALSAFNAFVRDLTELKRAEAELLRAERAAAEASAREQRRIAQDLHDGLGQKLTGISFLTKALQRRLDALGLPEAAQAKRIAEFSSRAVREAGLLAKGMLPVELSGGLAGALRELARYTREAFGVDCEARIPSWGASLRAGAGATEVYRTAQEAVSNSLKHGRARRVTIRLSSRPGRIAVGIEDDGRGLPAAPPRKRGLGLGLMRHRARMLGGAFEIRRRPGGGAIVTCSFPRAVLESG